MENLDIQKFLEIYPKNETFPVSDEIIERYVNVFPEILLKFWKEHGFGTYGNGLIQFINPDEYRETLNMWLMRADDGTRIPFAISAFGNVFYWRHIYNPNPNEFAPEQWVFDVSYFNPHNSQTGLCAYTMGEFFGEYLTDEEIVYELKWPNYFSENREENDNPNLFDPVLQKLGILRQNEMYFFVPALRLGGIDDVQYTEKGDARVHLDFLFQLTGEKSYNQEEDLYDYYTEIDKLSGTPTNFDQRIDELKSNLDANDAYQHYIIGKLYSEYPYYHESIQNQEDVRLRTNKLAEDYLNKAKEISPNIAKYHYASFQNYANNPETKSWDSAEQDLENFLENNGDEEIYLRGKNTIANYKDDEEGVEKYSQKLFEFTGNYSELNAIAEFLQYKEKYDKAEEIHKKIFNESNDYYDKKLALQNISYCYRELKKTNEAETYWDELAKEFPEMLHEITFEKGMLHFYDYENPKRTEIAETLVNQAIKECKDTGDDAPLASYFYFLHNIHKTNGDFEKALKMIERSCSIDPYHPFYTEEKAQILYKMGLEDEAKESLGENPSFNINLKNAFNDNNFEEVIYQLGNSPKTFDTKIEKLEAELAQDSNNAEKLFLLAKLYENYPHYDTSNHDQSIKEKTPKAYSAYNKAIDLDNNPVYKLHRAEFLCSNAYILGMETEESHAIMEKDYNYYIQHYNSPYEGYEGLKKMAQFTGNWEDIIKYAKLSYQEKPENTYALMDLGYAYSESERYPEAIQAYQEFLQAETDFHNQLQAKEGLAKVYIKSGEADRAEKMFEELAQNTSNIEEKSDVYNKLSSAFMLNDDLDKAIHYQEKAVHFAQNSSDNHTYPYNLLELSSLYEQKGNRNEAISIMQKVCNIRGENYDYSHLGVLYKENNQIAEAKAALNKALEINPHDEYSKEMLAEINNKGKGGFFSKWF